jgi:hypothetical protein
MDFGRSCPLGPLPSGWRHQKFWTRAPMTMAFTVKDGMPSMRFETHDSASMLFRHVDIDLAAYPMLVWRWYLILQSKLMSCVLQRARNCCNFSIRRRLREPSLSRWWGVKLSFNTDFPLRRMNFMPSREALASLRGRRQGRHMMGSEG